MNKLNMFLALWLLVVQSKVGLYEICCCHLVSRKKKKKEQQPQGVTSWELRNKNEWAAISWRNLSRKWLTFKKTMIAFYKS